MMLSVLSIQVRIQSNAQLVCTSANPSLIIDLNLVEIGKPTLRLQATFFQIYLRLIDARVSRDLQAIVHCAKRVF